jgi:hypothetical protein
MGYITEEKGQKLKKKTDGFKIKELTTEDTDPF